MVADRKPVEHLEKWLKNARSMETQMLGILAHQPEKYRHCPALADKIHRHWEESKTHVEKVTECLELLKKNRLTRDKWIHPGNNGKIISFMPNGINNSLTQYVIEHYEISQYKLIIEASRQTGHESIARLCEEILCQEEEMAFWLEYHLPELTQDYLQLDQADAGPSSKYA